MAYATGINVANLPTLVATELGAFAAAAGWTSQGGVYTRSISIGDLFANFRWDTSAAQRLAMYQSLGYDSGEAEKPWLWTGDDGQGATDAQTIQSRRHVEFKNAGPYPRHWFFASDAAPRYIYVVVEYASGLFRHFSFGNLIKYGTWTGGEFICTMNWSTGQGSINNPASTFNNVLFAAHRGELLNNSCLRATGLTGQHVDGKYLRNMILGWGNSADDRDGNQTRHCVGTATGGWGSVPAAYQRYSYNAVHKPLIPVVICDYHGHTTPESNRHTMLGEMPDVALINMHALEPAEEITVGADTWMVFPWVRKRTGGPDTEEESRNAGIAYKKIVSP